MSIDWSKYGVGASTNQGNTGDAKASVDFSKYSDPQPTHQDQQQISHVSVDNSQSPLAQQTNQTVKVAPQDKGGWNGIFDNPIGRGIGQGLNAVNVLSQNFAKYATPDAPMFTKDGKLDPNMTARQQFMKDNPQKSTGSEGLDKTLDFVGKAGSFYTPGAGLSNVAGLTGAVEAGLTKLAPKLATSTAGRIAQTAAREAIVGAPLGAGQYQAQGGDNLGEATKQAAFGAALGGAGGAAGSALSKSFDSLFSRFKPSETAPITQTGPVLGLPEPKSAIMAREAQNRSVLPPNTDVIHGKGDIATLGLPEGKYTAPTRLKVNSPDENLSYVMTKIKPEVMQTIQAPARRDLLVQYIQKNMDIPIDEIHNMPMTQLQNLGQNIQQDLHAKMPQIAADVAAKYGHDLPSLLEGQAPNLRAQIARDTQSQVYGVQPPKIGIQKPDFNVIHNADAAMPETKIKFNGGNENLSVKPPISGSVPNAMPSQLPLDGSHLKLPDYLKEPIVRNNALAEKLGLAHEIENLSAQRMTRKEIATSMSNKVPQGTDVNELISSVRAFRGIPSMDDKQAFESWITNRGLNKQSAQSQKLSDLKPPTKFTQSALPKDELKFAQTVKGAENTSPELKQALEDKTLYGKTTSDKINHADATKMIDKHGVEGAKNILLGLKRKPTPSEVVAGNIISQHYARLGGEANLQHSVDLVFKLGTEGRQMGQAIQAFSTWKKLDESGALMIATRNLNKDLKDTKDWRGLTTQEAQPIKEGAAKYQLANDTKPLADQVKSIIDNRNPSEPLTAAEKETFKQFQDQVKSLNEGFKNFLPKEKIAKVGKSDATIKEVSQIEPKARTRDQVVSFLDAKAEKARQRIAASRQMGFAAVNKGNPIIDYSIIGASHIAKGVVKLSDFTEQMIKDFGQAVKPQINEIFNRANNIFRKENGLPTVQELDKAVNSAIKSGTFTEEQAHQFKAWANEIGHMSDEFKTEATQDLQKAMNQIGTSTLGQKLSAIQTSSQLLSLPTTIRNVIGNEAFNIIEKINKITAVPLDMLASTLTGERHIVFKTNNQESYWKNWVKGIKGGWNGISPNGQFAAMDIHPEVFKSNINPFKYLQKLTGAELQSFDHAAYMRVYGETVGTYATLLGKSQGLSGKALNEAIPNLIKKLDQSIHDLADEAGRYATFQDDTLLSKIAVKTKSALNEYSTGKLSDAAVKAGLPENLSLRGFGAGDVVLKYAKTPANIVMRGIDYSPIGILRGLGDLVPLLGKKEFDQRKAVQALSRGITGTLGMTGLGYALASAGILTGSASSDKDIQQLDKMTGKGEYKVNWSALERYVSGGLDKNAAKWQKGDRIFDWGWLQPMAISLAMGVNAQQSTAKQKAGGTQSWVTTAKDGLIGGLKTIMSQPLLQGTQSLVDASLNVAKHGSWSGITNIIKGIPASFVPATLGQARNFSDNTSRITYDPSALKSALNMIINKIPGLDKQLPVAYDTLGNAKEQIQGGQANTLKQGLLSMVSPVKPTNYTVSPEAQMIIDLINATGDVKVAPRTPNSYLMVDKKKVPLTPAQYSEIQQKTGETTQKQLARLAPMLANQNVTDEIKVKEVIGILDKVGKQVRNDLNKKYPQFRPHQKVK